MNFQPRTKLERRVHTAAEDALAAAKIVTTVDVLHRLGWLPRLRDWEREQAGPLETTAVVQPDKLALAREILRRWADEQGLAPGESSYISTNRGRRTLSFTESGDQAVEREYRRHWISPDLSDKRREQLISRQNAAPDLVVLLPSQDWTCVHCRDTGPYLIMDNAGPSCLTCADMDHLIFLPAGDAALTRRAKKASGLSAVVVQRNTKRKRYERQGLLVEEAALEEAEQSCLADGEARLRRRERDRVRRVNEDLELRARMTDLIVRLFPLCPVDRAESIAGHTSLRGSGRVGRSAAGRALDEEALTRAVVASIRHEDTEYDELLMAGVEREEARSRIRAKIDSRLLEWRG